MPVDFYCYSKAVEPVNEFGIIDGFSVQGTRCSEVCYTRENAVWNVTVECNNRKDYRFIPVDNNIPLTRKNSSGKEETGKSCDAILYTNNTVCFIELKNDLISILFYIVFIFIFLTIIRKFNYFS